MKTARKVMITDFGEPEKMSLQQVDLPAPAVGEVQLRQSAIGFNFIDIYQRKGNYPLPLPTGLGHEAAGVVEAVGADVTQFKPGDRVAYMNAGLGAYADYRNVPAEKLVHIPDNVSDEQVAAMLFKGMTAQYLLRKTHVVKAGEIVLVHAAAGGVGQILCRWAKALGAFVVGTAGSAEKCAVVKAAGADAALDYSKESWPADVLAATGGKKAQVVYDSVGKDTFLKSLDCAAPFGTVVVFGAASGPAPAIEPELLNKKGCLFLTRPSVFPHNADPAVFRENAAELFAAIAAGHVQASIGAKYKLEDIVAMHRAAEARTTQGASLIIP
ncbi:quinone oxidoreductase family protein [Acetonema longum]|uniref:Zinc-containing alcohol dehydrogenase superfamily protein n=1 Tax=Acetonema longum DSM 6540 TaxID=1009370 RepID=F7NM94_9FIRM|nr:quinone oxidoreductase [Acetonema longum]EGO62832.1 zinc-containing alcohol dehydrogenase superfamily protein [Acetonema longum DSM 6540]